MKTSLIKMLGLIAPAAVAPQGVYVAFYDDDQSQIGDDTFNVGDPGCFTISPIPISIQFEQGSREVIDIADNQVNGPYCLHAYKHNDDGVCRGWVDAQEYEWVYANNNWFYNLTQNVSTAGNYAWMCAACKKPVPLNCTEGPPGTHCY